VAGMRCFAGAMMSGKQPFQAVVPKQTRIRFRRRWPRRLRWWLPEKTKRRKMSDYLGLYPASLAGPADSRFTFCATCKCLVPDPKFHRQHGHSIVAGPADAGSHETATQIREALESARFYVEAHCGARGLWAGMAEANLGRIDRALALLAASASAPAVPRETKMHDEDLPGSTVPGDAERQSPIEKPESK
jgi:hypothetical protein